MAQDKYPLTIAKTRLTPPRHNDYFITRMTLLKHLERITGDKQVTTVVAPPGYGKTALVADLVHHLPERTSLWLSLSEVDHDPAHFIASMSAALNQLQAGTGDDGLSVIRARSQGADHQTQIALALEALTGNIVECVDTPFWLVLEDYQRLNNDTKQAIRHWLNQLPPIMHIIIISRHDLALSRLRISRKLAELTVDDLRFSIPEVRMYLEKITDDTPDDTIVRRLHDYLQGWAAGLSLAGLLLEQQSAYPESVDELNRILTQNQDIYSYFAEEVLAGLSADKRQFLLDTSLLSELQPERCAAVSQQTDAGTILNTLYRQNLFIRMTGQAPLTYQYHDLFRDFLQHKLTTDTPDRLRDLHRRAIDSARTPEQAIHHAIEGHLWDEAATAILSVTSHYWQRNWIAQLEEWILALPEAVRDEYPRLLYWLGLCAFERNRLMFAQKRLEYARDVAQQVDDMATYSLALEILVSTHMIRANYEECRTLIPDAIDDIVGAPSKAGLYLNRMWLHLLDENTARAHQDLQAAAEILRQHNDPVLLIRFGFYIQLPIVLLPDGVDVLKRFCQQVQVHIDDVPTMLKLSFYELAGFLAFWQGKPETALTSCKTALDIRQRMANYPYLGLDAAVTRAMIHTLQQNFEQSREVFAGVANIEPDLNSPRAMINRYLFPRARILWQADDLRGVYDVRNQISEIQKDHLASVLIDILLALSAERWQDAETHLRQAEAIEDTRLTPLLMQHTSTVLRAYYHHCRSQPEAVVNTLQPVLEAARLNGTPGLLLKEGYILKPLLQTVIQASDDPGYAEYVLGLFQSETPSAADDNIQLTNRELDVLKLIATGATNNAIAQELFISVETVKTHVSNILRKFDATTRTEAVSIGYASNILQSN